LPGLRDYVKAFYPLGLVWGPAGGAIFFAPAAAVSSAKAPPPGRAPAPPPPPPATLFSSETVTPPSWNTYLDTYSDFLSYLFDLILYLFLFYDY